MKIRSLEILNFRGIKNVRLDNLQDMVVIAGPNGCGKSCILDAIRLIKSIYGGYQPNEIHQWMGEFQINFTQDPNALGGLMQDRSKHFLVSVQFELQQDEINYLRDNAEQLAREASWKLIAPELQGWAVIDAAPFATQMRARQEEVDKQTKIAASQLLLELDNKILHARISVDPNDPVGLRIIPSTALELVFSLYKPNVIGVIEFNGAKRHYERETLQGINFNLDAAQQQQQRSQTALYNYAAKYTNVKSEMASSYVREALAQRAGETFEENNSLTKTLQELFKNFFPDKEFLGPIATKDGLLKFPVRTLSGAEHDLNELSSGEKEILFGYLRLRNAAPKNSVILLDEPELHLNPRLLRGFPDFYHRNLGVSNNNQIWLVTHSDALLREAVGAVGFSVFHMSPPNDDQNQAKIIAMDVDLDRAIVDLVGDLASYRPGAKVVILEGEDSEFDRKMIATLFPEFSNKVNTISGGNKSGVERLRQAMEKATTDGKIPIKIYSITDADLDDPLEITGQNSWRWNVYHIENFLLRPEIIRQVLSDLRPGITIPTEKEILLLLRASAAECVPSLVRHVLQTEVNKKIVGLINTRIDPKSAKIADSLFEVLHASKIKMESLFISDLQIENLRSQEKSLTEKFNLALTDDAWMQQHRGREILKKFVGSHVKEVKYEIFRNLIMSKMAMNSCRPDGMKLVIEKIIAA